VMGCGVLSFSGLLRCCTGVGLVVVVFAVAYLLFSSIAVCGFYELCLSAEVCLSLSYLCGWCPIALCSC
jgi:hypothetical protein